MYEVRIESHFSSAHQIVGYEGDCADIHGHTFKVEVVAVTDALDKLGISIDFRKLKKLLGKVIRTLDHKNLNNLPQFRSSNPSTENIAKFIYTEMKRLVKRPISIKSVRVWESEGCSVVFYEGL